MEGGKGPVDLAFPAKAHMPDTLMNSLRVSVYFTPTGTRRGRDSCAHFTEWATEAHGDGESKPNDTGVRAKWRFRQASA